MVFIQNLKLIKLKNKIYFILVYFLIYFSMIQMKIKKQLKIFIKKYII